MSSHPIPTCLVLPCPTTVDYISNLRSSSQKESFMTSEFAWESHCRGDAQRAKEQRDQWKLLNPPGCHIYLRCCCWPERIKKTSSYHRHKNSAKEASIVFIECSLQPAICPRDTIRTGETKMGRRHSLSCSCFLLHNFFILLIRCWMGCLLSDAGNSQSLRPDLTTFRPELTGYDCKRLCYLHPTARPWHGQRKRAPRIDLLEQAWHACPGTSSHLQFIKSGWPSSVWSAPRDTLQKMMLRSYQISSLHSRSIAIFSK